MGRGVGGAGIGAVGAGEMGRSRRSLDRDRDKSGTKSRGLNRKQASVLHTGVWSVVSEERFVSC